MDPDTIATIFGIQQGQKLSWSKYIRVLIFCMIPILIGMSVLYFNYAGIYSIFNPVDNMRRTIDPNKMYSYKGTTGSGTTIKQKYVTSHTEDIIFNGIIFAGIGLAFIGWGIAGIIIICKKKCLESDKFMLWLTLRQLHSNNSDTRIKAVIRLSDIKDARVVKPLVNALQDQDSGVRKVATSVLKHIGDPEVQGLVIEYGKREKEWQQEEEVKRLMASGLLSKFVREQNGVWNHQNWLSLLASVRNAGYVTLPDNEVGRLLEEEKSKFSATKQPHREKERQQEEEIKGLMASGLLSKFVREQNGVWNHQDWLSLLASVRNAGYVTLPDHQVKRLLEEEISKFSATKQPRILQKLESGSNGIKFRHNALYYR